MDVYATIPPTPNTHLVSGNDVGPLLKKEVFSMETPLEEGVPTN